MSYYQKYKFCSPEPVYAIVQEELKSYFDTGAVDTTMFPIWTAKCLQKLGKASYDVNQALLCVEDSQARLPDDFYATREAWMCANFEHVTQAPNAFYKKVRATSTRIDTPDLYCNMCTECAAPDIIEAIYKTTHTVAFTTTKKYLLKPGNLYPSCPNDLWCANHNSASPDTYDVRDNKFVTTFKSGNVYLQYYSTRVDEAYNPLIPDDYRVKEFIEAFLKQKIFEAVFNQTTDETFNQSAQKAQMYKQMADEAYILAVTEEVKEDVYRKQRAIWRLQHRNNRFIIK